MSNKSLGNASSCTLNHQYHYIQYPAYFEHKAQHQQVIQTLSSSNAYCNCRCSCDGGACPGVQEEESSERKSVRDAPIGLESQMAVAAIVHYQASAQSQSEQSYQKLRQVATGEEKKPLNLMPSSSCNCELNCTCLSSADSAVNASFASQKGKSGAVDVMLGADEITVSESDNNSTLRKNIRYGNKAQSRKKFNVSNEPKVVTTTAASSSRDHTNCIIDMTDHRPPLPPRPAITLPAITLVTSANGHGHVGGTGAGAGIKKYVVWCLICGGFSCLLGLLFLGVYFLLHSYTITVGNFETVPTFVPATLLILTGLCVMSLARRRNRYSYLIKLSGVCGLISALTCALVTVTTTVLHMSRLQALRECEYAQKTRTCTCYSDMIESQVDHADKEGVRLVFDSLSDCGVVHGSLYSCLRAIFGLSVAGVLIAVFSCMLIYQLLSHERKKMYWEQLELRCRSLYTSQQGPPPNITTVTAAHNAAVFRCCEQCYAHRPTATYPSWDETGGEPRFWTGQPPGNFYSPNPGSEELNACPVGHVHRVSATRNRASGWSRWPRWWQRNSATDPRSTVPRQAPSSPDSQYGFSNVHEHGMNSIADEPAMTSPPQHNMQQAFNVLPSYGVWGPPPPYSDPNSPAHRSYYQYRQRHASSGGCNGAVLAEPSRSVGGNQQQQAQQYQHHQPLPCPNHHPTCAEQQDGAISSTCMQAQAPSARNTAKGFTCSAQHEYDNTDSDGIRDNFPNTLPTRKIKKRAEMDIKSIGHNTQGLQSRINVQQIFPASKIPWPVTGGACDEEEYNLDKIEAGDNDSGADVASLIAARHKRGVEGAVLRNCRNEIEETDACGGGDVDKTGDGDPAESEVYFADVSSCCNVYMKIDKCYEDAGPPHIVSVAQQQHPTNFCRTKSVNRSDDYLGERLHQREISELRSEMNSYDNNQAEKQTISKDISCQSLCSMDSEPKTDFTDISPSTPSSTKLLQMQFSAKASDDGATLGTVHMQPKFLIELAHGSSSANNFIASLPLYSFEQQSLEAHRRSTKNIREQSEGHYEVINDHARIHNQEDLTQPHCHISDAAAHHLPTERKHTSGTSLGWEKGTSEHVCL